MSNVLSSKLKNILEDCVMVAFIRTNPYGYANVAELKIHEDVAVSNMTTDMYSYTSTPLDIINSAYVENKTLKDAYLESIEYVYGYTATDRPDDVRIVNALPLAQEISKQFNNIAPEIIASLTDDELNQLNTIQKLAIQ